MRTQPSREQRRGAFALCRAEQFVATDAGQHCSPERIEERQVEVHVDRPCEAADEASRAAHMGREGEARPCAPASPTKFQTQMADYVLLPLVLVGFADVGKHVGDRNRGRQAFPPGQVHRPGKNRG